MSDSSPKSWQSSFKILPGSMGSMTSSAGSSALPLQYLVDDLSKSSLSVVTGVSGSTSVDDTVAKMFNKTVLNWGIISVENGKIIWNPPHDLPYHVVAHLQSSLLELNELLRTGSLVLGPGNVIQPK